MSKSSFDLSLIMPCYNEKKMLTESMVQICDVLNLTKFKYEIIFVDDGSIDGTVEAVKRLTEKNENIRLICHEKNMGRGRTVADGIREAKGRIVGFIDIDLSTPPRYIPSLALEIEKGADIATAWRVYKIELKYLPKMFHRVILHKGYRFLVRILLKTNLKDTETGCKFFNRERILPILNEIKNEHWFWDTEVMVRPFLKGYKIVEIPTVYIRRPESGTTVKIFKDTFSYLINLWRFYWELRKTPRSRI